jgi:acetyl esterase/lipase
MAAEQAGRSRGAAIAAAALSLTASFPSAVQPAAPPASADHSEPGRVAAFSPAGQVEAGNAPEPITWEEVLALPRPAPDHRIAYGDGESRFGELRLPKGDGPFPVVVLVHGGCWLAEFDLGYMASAAAALAAEGMAVWTLEYRRVGDPGGGWPGTFEDIGRGVDHLRDLADRFPLDLGRIVLAGHSAGGHLALWAAARARLPGARPLHAADPLPVRGVVTLAGITDLADYGRGPRDCNAAVARLMGGGPGEFPRRYAEGNPAALLPLGVPARLVQGTLDPIVPVDQARAFETAARAKGDDARMVLVEGAGHFDLVAPSTAAWQAVRRAILDRLGG